jgi:predicted RNase H-like HicB family nuclease
MVRKENTMTLEILVKPKGNGYRAFVKGYPECTVDAPTREEAVKQARTEAEDWMNNSEVIKVETSDSHRIPHRGIGMWAEDETFDDFVEAMKQYRTQLDADPDRF